MSYTFSCPSCGKPYTARDPDAGKKANCKKCGTTFRIPEPDLGEEPDREDTTMPVQCSCPECGFRYKIANELAGKTVLCPECKTRFKPKPCSDDADDADDELAATSRPKKRLALWILNSCAAVVLVTGIIVTVILFTKQAKENAAAADAIKALGKIEAATQVGVPFQQYNQLLIDAKAAVNEAQPSLPPGDLQTSITGAMDAYKDAATVWNHKIQFSNNLELRKEYGHGEIIARYNLPLHEVQHLVRHEDRPPDLEVNADLAMQLIWAVAAKHLADARSVLAGGHLTAARDQSSPSPRTEAPSSLPAPAAPHKAVKRPLISHGFRGTP